MAGKSLTGYGSIRPTGCSMTGRPGKPSSPVAGCCCATGNLQAGQAVHLKEVLAANEPLLCVYGYRDEEYFSSKSAPHSP